MAEYAREVFVHAINGPEITSAILAQNARTADLDQNQIDKLDAQWRVEFNQRNRPMIDGVMNNEVSRYLLDSVMEQSGRVTEIIVMDARGLTVGQSALTTDFWQGDEAKYQDTYLVGPEALHLSEIEQGETPTIYQKQVSMSIVEPSGQTVIGAITVTLNVHYFY